MDKIKNSAFEFRKIRRPNAIEKLMGKKIKENAIIEINNLLVDASPRKVSIEEVQNIAYQHGVKLRKDFLVELNQLYKQFLIFCLSDKYLSDVEVEELKHLKEILTLSDVEVGQIHNEVAGELYKMEVEKALEDRRLSEEEKDFLKQIQSNLKISDSLAAKIYQSSAKELLNKFMEEALSDKRLTDEEEIELNIIKKNLNVELYLEGSTRANFEKYKLFWQIENGEYPIFEIDLELDMDESCYFYTGAEWLEQNVSPKKLDFDGSSLRIKIAKGLHWKTENKELKPVLEDIWAVMDNGKLYLTNKRLILIGNEGDRNISLGEILDFSTYKNGINIIENEKTIFLQFKDHIDIFSMILGKAIMDY